MPDLNKVINGLECCANEISCIEKCPYNELGDSWHDCVPHLAADALELLKAQEPVAPYMDYDGQDVWRCGSCGATLFHLSHTQADEIEQNCVKFCRYCGHEVKW
jgi:hypothetical protein